jgi:hypothetical protein
MANIFQYVISTGLSELKVSCGLSNKLQSTTAGNWPKIIQPELITSRFGQAILFP